MKTYEGDGAAGDGTKDSSNISAQVDPNFPERSIPHLS
jgi:hypothetical protein